MNKKIITKEIYQSIKPSLKGKKVVLCHGVFDLVHPGHIAHFEEAKSLGDVLVVSITAAKYVRKGPGRPYFDDETRLHFLAAIECIDYVLLSECPTVDDIIEAVEPDLYVKGQEYANAKEDITGKIQEEVDLVRRHGGDVYYTSGVVYSSTKLINRMLPSLTEEVKEYLENFSGYHTIKEFRKVADLIQGKKVLVIGDVIIDKYTYCHVQGLMSKDMGYSARLLQSEEYLGGSIAVARHAASFSDAVTLFSVIGSGDGYLELIQREAGADVKLELFCSETYPTIVKQRFIEKNEKREELHKIFAIHNIPGDFLPRDPQKEEFKKTLRDNIGDYDIVLLCDFGHGLIDEEVIDIVQSGAKFLAINCQTNSSNYGMNMITKYSRADAFALDQRELKLAYPYYDLSEEQALQRLSVHLSSRGWLTRGSKGAFGVDRDGTIDRVPAFTLSVKDTIGAGDAFFVAASLFAAADAPIDVGTFMGNVAGALMANITGNREPIDKVNVLKYAATLLNI